jgi:hypothetical protein
MVKAVINTRSIMLGSVSSSNTVYNTDYAICRSNQPTSIEVKCSLPSSLVNFKSLNVASLTTVPGTLSSHTTNLNLRIDHDYTVPGTNLPKGQSKTIHLEGNAYWLLSGTSVSESDLISPTLLNNNNIEAIIPASSCANLTLKESITTILIPFTAIGSLKSEVDDSILASSVALQGTLTANVLGLDSSEIAPCN